jgi:hypothetical protein
MVIYFTNQTHHCNLHNMTYRTHISMKQIMMIEFWWYLLWPCGNRSFQAVLMRNRCHISSMKMNDVLRINCHGFYCSKFEFTIDGSCIDNHDSKLFFLQSPKTDVYDDDWSSMQKELWRLINNWWRLMNLCVYGVLEILMNLRGFEIQFWGMWNSVMLRMRLGLYMCV